MPWSNLEPADDPTIPCEVRLWRAAQVYVFIHPRDWKKVSVVGGTWMWITCEEARFTCRVASVGEHFRLGEPKDISPHAFGVPTHGDYPATASINWAATIPDLVKAALDDSAELCDAWAALSCEEMRSSLSHIFRARNLGAIADRQLALIRKMSRR